MAERGFLDHAMDFAEGVVGTLEAATGTTSHGGGTAMGGSSRPSGFEPSGEKPVRGATDNRTPSARPWRIVEVIRDDEYDVSYVVTNGIDECACSSRELAERVLRALA
jgi:hypothetical protein